VKAPTSPQGIGNGATEGGIIAPCSFSLPNNLTLLFNSQVDILKDTSKGGYHTANLVNLRGQIVKDVTSMENYGPTSISIIRGPFVNIASIQSLLVCVRASRSTLVWAIPGEHGVAGVYTPATYSNGDQGHAA
jgi:hypothetical protein